MKVKTCDLTGAALNWAVNVCEGFTPQVGINPYGYAVLLNGRNYLDWSEGGPLSERELIATLPCPRGWAARRNEMNAPYHEGPTLLVAAMRCRVASKLGDEIDIPEELRS